MREITEDQLNQLTKDHIEDGETECRWCFAIDLQRVKANIIAQHDFPDTVFSIL